MARTLYPTKSGSAPARAVPADAAGRNRASIWGFGVAMAGVVFIYALLPLGTALELGGDEGYELTKGFLVSKGFSLYTEIWNDQPPVLTMLLSCAFRAVGPSILVARVVAAGFGLLLFAALYRLVRERSSGWAATAGLFFLVASPGVLSLSSSVMLEVPAIGTALVSAWLLFQWNKRRRWFWLAASGAVMGVALQIKMTAVMVMPAILAEVAMETWRCEGGALIGVVRGRRRSGGSVPPHPGPLPWGEGGRARGCVRSTLMWGAGVTMVFLVIGLVWGGGSLQSSWRSHTVSKKVPGLSSPEDFRFEPSLLLRHPECLLAASFALISLGRQRRWNEIRFPAVLLATSLAVHSVHRPWWPYYYLHLAVPLGWLSGLGFEEVLKGVTSVLSVQRNRGARPIRWKWISAGVVAALALAVAEARLEGGIRAIRQKPRASDSPVLQKMKQYASQTHWVYVQPVIFPFHARLAVPPELAVVMLKRFWSGQITPNEIVDVCRRYKPEQVLLWRERVGREWKQFLEAGYKPAYQDTNYVLFVTRTIQDK